MKTSGDMIFIFGKYYHGFWDKASKRTPQEIEDMRKKHKIVVRENRKDHGSSPLLSRTTIL